MFNIKNIALSLTTLCLAGSIAFAAEINPTNERDLKMKVATWGSLADEAEGLLNSGESTLASELLNESIKSKKTVRNLTLKGDQYAKDNMKSNALYFYQAHWPPYFASLFWEENSRPDAGLYISLGGGAKLTLLSMCWFAKLRRCNWQS